MYLEYIIADVRDWSNRHLGSKADHFNEEWWNQKYKHQNENTGEKERDTGKGKQLPHSAGTQ